MFPSNREVIMGFLLLGIDSLIACVAIGPVVSRRWGVPLAALFGICDGGGFLLGSAWPRAVSDGVSSVVTTGILIALGVYLIVAAAFARTAQVSSSRGLAWALPFALAIDNVAFGVVGSHPGAIVAQAGEQGLSSALLAGLGLVVGLGLARALPATRRHPAVANGVAGGALIVASGVLLMVG
jgi:hypothetical protein